MSQDKNWVAQPKGESGQDGDFNPTWNPQEMPVIEGTLISSKPNVGKWNNPVYDVRTEDNTVFSVWGTAILSKQLDVIPMNSYIKIQYLGKKPGKNNSYHDFDVFVAGGQAPAPVATGQPVAAAPVAQPPQATAREAATPIPVAQPEQATPVPVAQPVAPVATQPVAVARPEQVPVADNSMPPQAEEDIPF